MNLKRTIAIICSCLLAVSAIPAYGHGESPLNLATLKTAELLWGDCPVAVEETTRCGTLDVPEDWSKPDRSKQIQVSFAVIPARKSEKPADPIIFWTGGPGVSAFAAIAPIESSPLRSGRDVIVFEPRGYGYSNPALLCENRFEELRACHKKLTAAGIDLSKYTTEISVHDVEALRLALGLSKINLVGVSYGTTYSLAQARLYPAPIRSMVLDAPYPYEAQYDYRVNATLNAMGRVFDHCRADERCNHAYPDLRSRFFASLRRLDKSPETVRGQPMTAVRAMDVIYDQLYDSVSMPGVPQRMNFIAEGDFEALLDSVKATSDPQAVDPTRRYASGLNAATECADDIPFKAAPETRVARNAPWPEDIVTLLRPEGWNYDRICAEFPVPPSSSHMGEPVHSNIPSLIIAGAFDPTTPPDFAEAMALSLPGATILVDQSAAHAVLTTTHECIWRTVGLFLASPDAEVDRSCLANIPPVQWVLPAP